MTYSAPLISVFGTSASDSHVGAAEKLIQTLAAEGFRIAVDSGFAENLPASVFSDKVIASAYPPESTKMIISVGGDGTFLRAAEWTACTSIPVLGLNSGNLGYLTSYSTEEIPQLSADLRAGNLRPEHRGLIEVRGENLPEGVWPFALNEVSFLKEDTSSMINVHTDVDGFWLTDYLADGLLIATPTGSTGYNLSVGGPILQPELDCWILSPVAPHTLTMRPLALSSESEIRVKVTSRAAHFRLSLDGRSFILPCGSYLTLRKAPFRLTVLRRNGDNFASTLRKKLLWGQR